MITLFILSIAAIGLAALIIAFVVFDWWRVTRAMKRDRESHYAKRVEPEFLKRKERG